MCALDSRRTSALLGGSLSPVYKVIGICHSNSSFCDFTSRQDGMEEDFLAAVYS